MPRAMELAQQMASKSPVALYYAKESTNRSLHGDIGGNLVHEADLYSLMFSTDDARRACARSSRSASRRSSASSVRDPARWLGSDGHGMEVQAR